MMIDDLMKKLYDKDTSIAYPALLKLEALSNDTNELYSYVDYFYEMIFHPSYFIRIRGFRLFCKQAKWDKENKINYYLHSACCMLHDEKPTAVRQALSALHDVAQYKKDLHELIKEEISHISLSTYKESMQSLIQKDRQQLLRYLTT